MHLLVISIFDMIVAKEMADTMHEQNLCCALSQEGNTPEINFISEIYNKCGALEWYDLSKKILGDTIFLYNLPQYKQFDMRKLL